MYRAPPQFLPGRSRVPDNTNTLNLIGRIGDQLALNKKKKRAGELAEILVGGSPEEKQAAGVELQEMQGHEQVEQQANEQRRVQRSNSNLQRLLTNPESKAALIELQGLDPQMAGTVLDIMKGEDAAQKQQLAVAAQEALRLGTNLSVIATNEEMGGIENSKRLLIDAVRQMKAGGDDAAQLESMLDLDGDDYIGATRRMMAMSGATLKAQQADAAESGIGKIDPGEYTPESIQQFNQTGDYSALQRPAEAPVETQADIGKPSPKDFTVDSIARYQQSGNPADLERYHSANDKRGQKVIADGLTAAQSIPMVKRSIELLDSVRTGGLDAVKLRAKQAFGVEGANEAELSANLGKAVISQYREVFGSQFTEREGAKLDRIEAGFGKSVAGNKRLLGQLMKLSELKVKQARRRAEFMGDTVTLDEIDEYMNMDLTPTDEADDSELFSKYGIE